VIQSATTEGEQGGILESEEGQSGHQDVGQGEMGCPALFGHLLETTAGQGDQSVKMEMTPLLHRRVGSVHDSPS